MPCDSNGPLKTSSTGLGAFQAPKSSHTLALHVSFILVHFCLVVYFYKVDENKLNLAHEQSERVAADTCLGHHGHQKIKC